jgi:hypothetical protein
LITAASVTFAISAASPASVNARVADAARERRRCQQLRVGGARVRERPIRFREQRRSQILLSGCSCRECGEQASEYREPSESH